MSAVLGTTPLTRSPWPTLDPFLFCAYHNDAYPVGTPDMAPAVSTSGRTIGRDFSGRDGWSMYHGQRIPGFPRHPHRGFETITLVREGRIDHSDSMGATARFGSGDCQWMTAGKGIMHAEMFPLLRTDAPNPLNLFQIWLNLPAADKMVEPYFTMLWAPQIPRHLFRDAVGRTTEVVTVAGSLGKAAPPCPPNSWASEPEHDVAIWTIEMDAGASWTLPAAPERCNRALYFHTGGTMLIDGQLVTQMQRLVLRPNQPVELASGLSPSSLLLLQGRPISEPIARRGPFVMNTQAEIQQAYADYRSTKFGGWPFDGPDPVHSPETTRFARHADGRVESAG